MFNLTNEQVKKILMYMPIIIIVISTIIILLFYSNNKSKNNSLNEDTQYYTATYDTKKDSYDITLKHDYDSLSDAEKYEIYHEISKKYAGNITNLEDFYIPSSDLTDNEIYRNKINEFESMFQKEPQEYNENETK